MKSSRKNINIVLVTMVVFTALSLAGCSNLTSEDGSTTNTGPDPVITAGLYAKAMPISASDIPIDLSGIAGATIVDQAVTYINANPGTYTLLLDSDVAVAGDNNRGLNQTNTRLTIVGLAAERKISLNSAGRLFTVGTATQSGIELTIGNNITLAGYTENDQSMVWVQDNAGFTMQGNAKITGNNIGGVWVNSGSSLTMSGNASVYGNTGAGVWITDSSFTMQDSATVYGNVSTSQGGGVVVYGGTFILGGSASVNGNSSSDASGGGGVFIGTGGSFTIQDYAVISGNTAGGPGGGVYVSSSGSFLMSGGTIYGNDTPNLPGNIASLGAVLYVAAGGSAVYGNGSNILPHTDSQTLYTNLTVSGNPAVTFVYDNGSPNTVQSIIRGGKAEKPEPDPFKNLDFTPTTAGLYAGTPGNFSYTFAGWYMDGTATPFNFNTSISANITLTARWTSPPIDLSDYVYGENTIVDRTIAYVNYNPGTYTLMLDTDVNATGYTLNRSNVKLTIIGLGEERKIIKPLTYYIFRLGADGQSGIELTIGENITLVGYPDYDTWYTSEVVQVQDNAVFTMRDNAKITGNIGSGIRVTGGSFTMQDYATVSGNGDAGVYVDGGSFLMLDNATVSGNGTYYSNAPGVHVSSDSTFIMQGNATVSGNESIGVYSNGTFIMQDSATISGHINNSYSGSGGGVYVNGGSFTMQDNASVSGNTNNSYSGSGGGVCVEGGSFTMQDNASVYGNISNSGENGYGGGVYVVGDATFTMHDNASVSGNEAKMGGGVYCGNGSHTFIMQDDATVSDNKGGGVYCNNGSTFIMLDDATVSNNEGSGVNNYGTFTMQDNATVSGNEGSGVHCGGTFTMQDNASIYDNSATSGGGVYIRDYWASFTMQDNAAVYGNKATGSGGGVYNNRGNFIMSGGTVYGNSAGANSNTAATGAALFIYSDYVTATAEYGDGSDILPHTDGHTDYTDDTITGRE